MEEHQKRGYLLENFRLFHLQTPVQEQVDFHYHEFCKLLFLVSGQGNYVVDGQRWSLRSGDVVLVDSRRIHCPELTPSTPYERVILYIDPDFLQRCSTPDCNLRDCFCGIPVLRFPEARRQKLFRLVLKLEQALSGDACGRDILSTAILLELLVALCRGRQQDLPHPEPVIPQSKRIQDIMSYMDAHLSEDLDVQTLADRFFVSKHHMMRLFHAQTGFTVHTYLLQRRLYLARELLQNGMRATEACYRAGFRSYCSFTRAYTKYFGTTPTGRTAAAHYPEDYA